MARNQLATKPRPADVLVIFGITGDLAKVMTFRSLYRLEARGRLNPPTPRGAGGPGGAPGLLTSPIGGVAGARGSHDDLTGHAREAIEATGEKIEEDVFERLAGRM